MKLPVHTSQVGLPGEAAAVRASPGMAFSALPGAAQAVAGAMFQLGGDLAAAARKQDERNAAVEGARLYADAGLDWAGRFQKAQDEAPLGADGFTPNLLKSFDDDVTARLATAPELARPFLATKFAALREHMGEKALTFEAHARLDQQTRGLTDVIGLGANGVRTDFDRWGDALGTAEGAISASNLSAAAKQKISEHARHTIINAAVQGLNERDPDHARQLLDGGAFDTYVTPEAKDRLVNDNIVELHRREVMAEQQRRLAEAERRAAVADMREESRFAMQALHDGVGYAGLPDLVKRADALDPKIAASLRMAHADLGWTANVRKMAPAEIVREIQSTRAAAEAADNPALAATLAHRLRTGEMALKQVAEALERDPQSWAEAQGVVPATPLDFARPETLQARVRAIAATRERYGIDVPLLKPADADGIVHRITTAKPEAMADMMQGVAGYFGEYWPSAYRQLAQHHDLPPEYGVLATVDAATARVKLAEAFQLGKDAVRKSIDKDAAKDIDDAVDGDALHDFRATFAHAPDGPRVVGQYAEATRLLAYQYARTMPKDAAVAKAVRDIAADRYDFVVDDSHQARAPRGAGAKAEAYADSLRNALTAEDLPDPQPASRTTTPDYRRSVALSAARRGVWVTTPMDDGWLLLDVRGVPVVRADGTPLRFSFADMKDAPADAMPGAPSAEDVAAMAAPIGPAPDALGVGQLPPGPGEARSAPGPDRSALGRVVEHAREQAARGATEGRRVPADWGSLSRDQKHEWNRAYDAARAEMQAARAAGERADAAQRRAAIGDLPFAWEPGVGPVVRRRTEGP